MIESQIDEFGTTRWFLNGKLHREDGPAIEHSSGSLWWYKNGKLHRVDGPAIEWFTGDKEWWVYDKQCTEEEFILLQFSNGITINE